MTQIEFHTGLSDWTAYACALLRKAYKKGAQVLVVGKPHDVQTLDTLLWIFSACDFIPHEVHSVQAAKAEEQTRSGLEIRLKNQDTSPIVLATDTQAVAHGQVLVCLPDAQDHPAVGFERFDRLIELVSTDSDITVAARKRWKYCQDRGYPLKNLPHASHQSVG